MADRRWSHATWERHPDLHRNQDLGLWDSRRWPLGPVMAGPGRNARPGVFGWTASGPDHGIRSKALERGKGQEPTRVFTAARNCGGGPRADNREPNSIQLRTCTAEAAQWAALARLVRKSEIGAGERTGKSWRAPTAGRAEQDGWAQASRLQPHASKHPPRVER